MPHCELMKGTATLIEKRSLNVRVTLMSTIRWMLVT